MKYFWILHFQKWARTRAARSIKKFAKFLRFELPRIYARIHEKSGTRAFHDARARARAHVLNMSTFQPNWKLIKSSLKVDGYCERMQLRNRSNKTKTPFFSVSFASLMWKKCRKTFCRYFHLWKFHCWYLFQTHLRNKYRIIYSLESLPKRLGKCKN